MKINCEHKNIQQCISYCTTYCTSLVHCVHVFIRIRLNRKKIWQMHVKNKWRLWQYNFRPEAFLTFAMITFSSLWWICLEFHKKFKNYVVDLMKSSFTDYFNELYSFYQNDMENRGFLFSDVANSEITKSKRSDISMPCFTHFLILTKTDA